MFLKTLLLLGGLLPAMEAGAQTITPIPRAAMDSVEPNWEVTVNNIPLQVSRSKATAHVYSTFTADRPVSVKVLAKSNAVVTPRIFPELFAKNAVQTPIAGTKNIQFTFSMAPGNRMFIDFPTIDNRLHLSCDSISKDPVPAPNAANVINVGTLGIPSDGTGDGTAKIQQAMNEAAAAGKIVYFPHGYFRSGTLYPPSNSKIYFAPGATLQSVKNIKAFPQEPWPDWNGWFASALIHLKSTKADTVKKVKGDTIRNVKIWGYGHLDGLAQFYRCCGEHGADSNTKTTVFRSLGAENVEVSDITIRNSPECHFMVMAAKNFTVRRLKIWGTPKIWSDGFGWDCSQDVNIQDVWVAARGDDGFVMKNEYLYNWGYPMKNLRADNVMTTGNQGLKIGWRAHYWENMSFSNIFIYGGVGVGIEPNRPARAKGLPFNTEKKTLKNVLFRNIEIGHDVSPAISFNTNDGSAALGNVEVSDFRFENVNITKDVGSKSDNFKNVKFVNLNLNGKMATSAAEAKMTLVNTQAFQFTVDPSMTWVQKPPTVRIPYREGRAPVSGALRGEASRFRVNGSRWAPASAPSPAAKGDLRKITIFGQESL